MHDHTTNQQPMPENNTPHNELEAIKNEVTAKMAETKDKNLPWGNITVTVILAALTLMSVGQTVESVYIFNKLKSGNIGPSTGAPQANSPQNAPDMVGGC
ncbi:MAG: hypothetical protein G01um101413_528 [Parcubacteria group bacterium Gr01-1014_13]|nr:MAG: hypothetical protein G01um101413_528 [Parcubacteria group bacterium Gr01-1014_13]